MQASTTSVGQDLIRNLSSTISYANTDNPRDHDAIILSVTSRGSELGTLINNLLGADGLAELQRTWGKNVNFDKAAPESCELTILADSSNKAPLQLAGQKIEASTQQKELHDCGLEFANPAEATLICATVVAKAKQAGFDLKLSAGELYDNLSADSRTLSKAEVSLLKILKEGSITTKPTAEFSIGSLGLNENGLLTVFYINHKRENLWAGAKNQQV